MKTVGRNKWIAPLVVAALVACSVWLYILPHSFDSIAGYAWEEVSVCGINVTRNDLQGSYYEVPQEEFPALMDAVKGLGLKYKGDGSVIRSAEDFAFYIVTFADQEGASIQPDFRVDYAGDIYMDNVKYQVVGENPLLPLLEKLSEPREIVA